MKYAVKCPSTRNHPSHECKWTGDISECKSISDSDFGRWWRWWECPKCGSKVAEVNHNTPLNHPLINHP